MIERACRTNQVREREEHIARQREIVARLEPDENRVFLEGDRLVVEIKNDRQALTSPAGGAAPGSRAGTALFRY